MNLTLSLGTSELGLKSITIRMTISGRTNGKGKM
jgi:hypothetical protein